MEEKTITKEKITIMVEEEEEEEVEEITEENSHKTQK